ncbi:MAG: sensor histidine kinase [Planctomycetota bacterium]|jgi:signal transduction histidine kinase
MWYKPKTLRLKLTLVNLLVFGGLLIALGATVLFICQRELKSAFDERLSDRAELMAERMNFDAEKFNTASPIRRTKPRLIPYRLPGYFFQLYLDDGTLIEKSTNLGDITLPLSSVGMRSRDTMQPVLETLSGSIPNKLFNQNSSLRLLTLYHDREEVDPFYLQVAVSLEPVNTSIRSLRNFFFWLMCGGLLLAALASWLLAKRSLTPIGEIAREAQEMGAAHLDRRLTLPTGRDELHELTLTLNDMLERLEAAFKAQERFLANAAHELKTPVAVLLGESQVLGQKERTPEEYDRFMADVQDEMRRLGQIINSMLILARADAGLPLPSIELVSINEVAMEAVTRCQIQAGRQEVRLIPVLAMPENDQPEPRVNGDPELLIVAVTNLIRNAIRYSPVQEPVEITVTSDTVNARISVRDRGQGVPEELKEQLFERFYSSSQMQETTFKGIGLGLAIAKGVARLHRGKINVYNHTEGGAVFVIELPLSISAYGETN